MKTSVLKASFFLFGLVTAGGVYAADGKETDCTNGKDDDGDTVFDCGDSDCKADPTCKPDRREEATETTCSD